MVGTSQETRRRGEQPPAGQGDDGGGGESTPGNDTTLEDQRLPKDLIFDLLSAKRRRNVLEYMAEHGEETTLSDLANHIAAAENDTEIRLLDSQQRKRVYVALYQCHLPRMDDADVIDFEHARGTVQLRPNATVLYRYMRLSSGDSEATGADSDRSVSDRVTAVRSKIEALVPHSH